VYDPEGGGKHIVYTTGLDSFLAAWRLGGTKQPIGLQLVCEHWSVRIVAVRNRKTIDITVHYISYLTSLTDRTTKNRQMAEKSHCPKVILATISVYLLWAPVNRR
jgi:hypothetical protein